MTLLRPIAESGGRIPPWFIENRDGRLREQPRLESMCLSE